MSGLAGLLRTDGGPVDPAALEAMVATMGHRGPDGTGAWVRGEVGVAHLLLRTTTGAREQQPVTDPSGTICLTVDGRVDDRAGLRRDLGGDQGELRDGSDAELLLRAYLRWGASCLSRVVGEFAVALWDGRTRQLLLARDFLGKRPLLYHHGPRGLRWASEMQAVLCDRAVPRSPNVAMVGEHLSLAVHSTTETLVESVRRVPPGHVLVVADGRVRTERHWDADRVPIVRKPTADHVAELAETFTSAVRASLDAPGPVAAELSGGVDSSSVVVVADRLVRDGRAAGPLDLLGLVFPGKLYDESEPMRLVADHVHRPVAELAPVPAGSEHYVAQIERHLELPEPPNMAMHRSLHALARERGARVLLTGKGGDERFTGSPYVYADALRRGHLMDAWRTARAERDVWGARTWLHQLGRDGIGPLLPDRLQRWGDRARGRARLPAWLPARFWEGLGLPERIRPDPLRGPDYARAAVVRLIGLGSLLHTTESSERTLAEAGLEARSPFDDRRVVELALALPEELRRRGYVTKWVVREALADLLPPATRTRLDKAELLGVLYDEMAHQGGAALFADLAIADLGWVDPVVARGLWTDLEVAHEARSEHPGAWALWTMLSTERWARAIF